MLGAGMVLIQDKTNKIVVIYEKQKKYWFFPRGRKDIGESLEQTALREAYEESGYRAEFLPLFTPHRAPAAPHDLNAYNRPDTEPIFICLTSWQPRRRRGFPDNGGEYLTSWYVGRIAENAIPQSGTGMPDEQNYESYLLTFEEALPLVFGAERHVLEYAWTCYIYTLENFRETGQGRSESQDLVQTSRSHTEARQL